MRILNTRPIEHAQTLTDAIHAAHGISVALPTLSIQPTTEWLETLPGLNSIQQALFVSKPAIYYFFSQLSQAHIAWPSLLPITVLGQGSAEALADFGFTAQHIPSLADSEHVLRMAHLQHIQNQSILIVKGQGGRPLIEDTLTQRGAQVYPVVVYQRQLPEKNPLAINAVWQNDAVDIILFTSQQAMEQLFMLMGDAAHRWIQAKPCVVISQRLAKAATELGIKTIITCRYEQLLQTLEGFAHDTR